MVLIGSLLNDETFKEEAIRSRLNKMKLKFVPYIMQMLGTKDPNQVTYNNCDSRNILGIPSNNGIYLTNYSSCCVCYSGYT